jgi:diguanylate cyclase (GGDEF)-like protein
MDAWRLICCGPWLSRILTFSGSLRRGAGSVKSCSIWLQRGLLAAKFRRYSARTMISRLLDLLLGTERKQRLRLARSLGAVGVFAVCLMVQWLAVSLGMADRSAALALTWFVIAGVLVCYLSLRTGWSQRWSDPALTMPQMVYSLLALMLAYGINPQLRGLMPMIMALVLVFGAFILPARRCRQLGWLSVAMLAIVMYYSAARDPVLFEPRIEGFNFLFSALVLPIMGSLAGQLSSMILQQRVQKNELREALEKVRLLASFDELTGLPNRRQVMEVFSQEERRSLRQSAPLCCAIIDIDFFKQINDRMGHPAGDEALQRFSALLSAALRANDVLARWGGEEFMLLLPKTAVEEAAEVLERLRGRCAARANWLDAPHLQVTFSAGLVALQPGEPTERLIARADAALYLAKAAGRNRVMLG